MVREGDGYGVLIDFSYAQVVEESFEEVRTNDLEDLARALYEMLTLKVKITNLNSAI